MKEKQTKKFDLNLDLFYQGGAIFIGILLTITLIRNILVISSANQKMQNLKKEIVDINIKNENLKKQIQISSTEEFKEQQARDKLGLVKEGETIIVLPETEILKKFSPKIEEEQETLPEPNWKKWLNLFI
ncbi:septum formation initiator family protein [Candidatus Microgenomates bacterium]|nr:septum formation initiator family protein [Candidatus Microgenomates bacterium]